MVCQSAAKVGGVHSHIEECQDKELYDAFMGAVADPSSSDSNPWVVTLEVNGNPVIFCIDSGAEVTVVLEQAY